MTNKTNQNNTTGLGIKKGLSTVQQLVLLGGGKLKRFPPTKDQIIINMLEGRPADAEFDDDMPKTLYGVLTCSR